MKKLSSSAQGNLGFRLAGNWVVVQDKDQAAGYKIEQDGELKWWATVNLGSRGQGKWAHH